MPAGLNDAANQAWIATRTKALLSAADRSQLQTLKRLHAADPHVVAAIDLLLAP